MAVKRCGLCGLAADEAELIWLRGLRGAVCRPGFGCDTAQPRVADLADGRLRTATDSMVSDIEFDDIMVENPKHLR